jgi:hypothetical protein
MTVAEIVANIQPRHHSGETFPRLFHAEQFRDRFPQREDAVIRAAQQRDLRHRVAQYAGADRMALGMIAIEQAFR